MYRGLSYDDVLIVPKYSDIESRSQIDLKTRFTKNYNINIPLVASPMDTVCEYEMAIRLNQLGAVGIIHRFMSIEEQVQEINKLVIHEDVGEQPRFGNTYKLLPTCAAVGATGDYQERTSELAKANIDVILIDVAHGHTLHVKKAIEWIKSNYPDIDVIAGNIATAKGAVDLAEWGADAVRAGIGGGSHCSTRVMTSVGYPMATMLDEINREFIHRGINIPIIADGGIRTPGDVALALSLGADTVMIGSLFSGTKETPGPIHRDNNWPTSSLYKQYRGAASYEAKSATGQRTNHVEGVSSIVEFKGPVDRIVNEICDGVRSSMSYVGARDINEFHNFADHIEITTAGFIEGTPHGLKK